MNLLQTLAFIKEPNYTTPEQAQKLLDLGIPMDSADCYYDLWKKIQWRQSEDLHNDFFVAYPHYKPCWSVGQLIKIYLICNPYENDDDLIFMLTSGVEVPDLCHYIITWLEYIKPNFNKVNKIIA